MLFISHRGNLNEPISHLENTPEYIEFALNAGHDVEIDVWWYNDGLYLGHDQPTDKMPERYLDNIYLWFHCKNVEALQFFRRTSKIKYFWHQTDDYALTSNRKLWTYPGKKLVAGAVAVLPELGYDGNLWECHAICTDYLYRYKVLYEEVMYPHQRPASELQGRIF